LLVVECVEEGGGRRERFAVSARLGRVDERCVADPDAHQEPVAVSGGQRRVGRRDVGGLVHPEVEDSRGDHDVVRRGQQVVDRVEHRRVADIGYPQRSKAQFIQFRCGVG
jgi:hypothetical protein